MKAQWIHCITIIPLILFVTACEIGGGNVTGGAVDDTVSQITSAEVVTLPDTGQNFCYYDFTNDGIYIPLEYTCVDESSAWGPYGQDGNFSINPMSFTDNGDGTIYDNVTGLTWQKCSYGESGDDCSTGTIGSYTWSDAVNQCTNLSLAGSGWRLPTVNELMWIVDYGKTYSAIDELAFPGTASSPYWTATTHQTVTTWAWYVNFAQANTWVHEKAQTYYVRCVRG